MFYARPPPAVQQVLRSDPPELQRLAREFIAQWTRPYTMRRQRPEEGEQQAILMQSDTFKQVNHHYHGR